jgi:hypothetical protein
MNVEVALSIAYFLVGAGWASFRTLWHWREYLKGWPRVIMPWYATVWMVLCVLVAVAIGWACVAAVWPVDLWKWNERDRPGSGDE